MLVCIRPSRRRALPKRLRLRIRSGMRRIRLGPQRPSLQTSGSTRQAVLRAVPHVQRMRYLQRIVLPVAETSSTGPKEGKCIVNGPRFLDDVYLEINNTNEERAMDILNSLDSLGDRQQFTNIVGF